MLRELFARLRGPREGSIAFQRADQRRLYVIDPALSLSDINHHRFLASELATACREHRIACTILASAFNQPPGPLDHGVVPFFHADTYYFFADLAEYEQRSP